MKASRGKKIALSPRELNALEGMLGALKNNRLEIGLAPSKHIENATRGKKIRVVVQVNADWYRRFCADFPSSRKRDNRTFDTAIRRPKTIVALERMLLSKTARSVYAHRIMKYIPGFLQSQEDQFQFEKASYESASKQQVASSEEDDWAPF